MSHDPQPLGGKIISKPVMIFGPLIVICMLLIVKRLVFGLGSVSDLNGGFPWGVWIAFDLLIGMEQRHVDAMCRRFGADAQGKVHRLLDYTGTPGDIADPWYTRDFETAYAQIEAGCRALLAQLEQAAQ